MLSSQGFQEVYNVAGGIKGWNGNIAFGPEDMGLELFDGNESAEKTLTVAYSLEQGLREFYLSMEATQSDDAVKKLFSQFAEIEIKHQERIFTEYLRITGKDINRHDFEETIVVKAVEGGLTTEQYIEIFKPDLNSAHEVVALAMSIEAQALDMYQRAAYRSGEPEGKKVLSQIASEEQTHLQLLGNLMDSL
jgi:rubrerythrin